MADVKNNLRAVAAPQATDDTTQGYEVGSLWFDGAVLWRCYDATEDAAGWETVPAGFRRLAGGKSASHTGNTSETTLATISLPPPGPKGGVRLTLIPKYTGTAGTKTLRAKFNGNGWLFNASVAASLSGYFQRTLFADNSESAQLMEFNAALGPAGHTGNAVQTYTVDWTVARDMTITMQLGSAADSCDWVYYLVEHMYAR